jgi:methyl-accepting chemotaxis protein
VCAGILTGIVAIILLKKYFTITQNGLVDTLKKMADGDFTVSLVSRGKDDTLAAVFNDVMEKLRSMVGGVASGTETMGTYTEGFLTSAGQIIETAERLKERSTQVSADANDASGRVVTVAAATEEMSTSVASVATAIEELSTSINEVAKNCQREFDVTTRANKQAIATRQLMELLGEKAQAIGKVIDIIKDVADQINLLSLNATIEAASAGDAGRGFAVVAAEVKQLSKQTAKATQEITEQVQTMQKSTTDAIKGIEDVNKLISEVTLVSQTIVSAVEEQSATVNEISRNVAGARGAADDISRNINTFSSGMQSISTSMVDVDKATDATTNDITQMRSGVKKLARLVLSLQNMVGNFTVKTEKS